MSTHKRNSIIQNRERKRPAVRLLTIYWLLATVALHAETGYNAWLRYAPVEGAHAAFPAVITTLGNSTLIASARQEVVRGVRGMLGRTLRIETGTPSEPAIVLGTLSDLHLTADLKEDGFWLKTNGRDIIVTASNDRGVLYGAFALLRKIGLGESIDGLDEKQSPHTAIRWVNQWDNLDGTIERGYGGRSIFWEAMRARADLSRVADYGRMLASLGINGCAINNVNANPRALAPDFLPEVARIAWALRPWGVRVALSVDLGSPKTLGGLDTFDPTDPRVAEWWKSKVDEVYRAIPDLAGFVMKADSEGRVGPSAYGRTHADAANVVARALAPHGGLIFYRGFVYDHHADWRNLKNDRARAAWDNFHDLDGKFDANVMIQVKNGPIDFQVREPASPLFGALAKTNVAIELQITQEYFGQARHTVFLVPMWKEVLDFDMHARGDGTPVKSLVKAFVGVANVGLDDNWCGNELSQANLYSFGRLAWNADLTSQRIVEEWTRLTFGNDQKVIETIDYIRLGSWHTYENYTGPLGLQTLTDIVGNHYGVAVEASERNGWGQWHRADEQGVGMDRTVATGTGFIGQYSPAVARIYESLATCPDDLLLFMHHVPYTHVLHNGGTVIQYIYNSHYKGVKEVSRYVETWRSLKGHVDDHRYQEVLAQLEYQEGQSEVWRDAVVSWFEHASGVPGPKPTRSRPPGTGIIFESRDRIEAESMKLDGYEVKPVIPWESASGGKAVACPTARCVATFQNEVGPGWFTIGIRYFDLPSGVAHFRVWVANQLVDEWDADGRFPARKLDGSSSNRRLIRGIALRPGDEIRFEGTPDRGDPAALDYVEIIFP